MPLTRLLIVTTTTSVIGVASFAVFVWQKFSDGRFSARLASFFALLILYLPKLPDDLDTCRVPSRHHEDEMRICAPLYSLPKRRPGYVASRLRIYAKSTKPDFLVLKWIRIRVIKSAGK